MEKVRYFAIGLNCISLFLIMYFDDIPGYVTLKISSIVGVIISNLMYYYIFYSTTRKEPGSEYFNRYLTASVGSSIMAGLLAHDMYTNLTMAIATSTLVGITFLFALYLIFIYQKCNMGIWPWIVLCFNAFITGGFIYRILISNYFLSI